LRLASPVIDKVGKAMGIVVVNLDMRLLLDRMTSTENEVEYGQYQLFSAQGALLSADENGQYLTNTTTLLAPYIWKQLLGKLHQHTQDQNEVYSSSTIIPSMYLEQIKSEYSDVNIVTDELSWYLVNRQSTQQLYRTVYFETWLAVSVALIALFIWNYLSRSRIHAEDIANTSLRRTHMLGDIMRRSSDLVFITDTNGQITYVNQSFEETTGYEMSEIVGKSPNILKSGLHDETFYARLWGALCDGKEYHALFTNRKKNGELFYNQASLSPVKDHHGEVTGYVCMGKDISDSHTLKMALYDNLTGLFNRAMFFDRLRYTIALTKRNKSTMALFYLDLDGFKQVNDRHGHEMGDALLIEASDRLNKVFRESDTLARLGGDEFVVLVQDPVNQADIEHIGQKCLDLFDQTWMVNDQEIDGIGVSIGITIYDGTYDVHPDVLLEEADSAMYQTKQNGKNHFRFYTRKGVRSVKDGLSVISS
jgi:diguanylate cyclase (GGDEF)-like protein/PAS domain S-box-containing protein